jgi:hypothetical protein
VHRVALSAIFFLNGAAFSSWYARLASIQQDLGLGPRQIDFLDRNALGAGELGTPVRK